MVGSGAVALPGMSCYCAVFSVLALRGGNRHRRRSVKHIVKESCGARLYLPRDLQLTYTLGRVAASPIQPLWPLFFGSYHTARHGFGRLVKLGLIRSFPRHAPCDPKWFSLTRQGLEWVLDQCGCPESELRLVTGLKRLNLRALIERNYFWVSLALAARANPAVKLGLFRPEWELRRIAAQTVPVVPDFMFTLECRDETKAAPVVYMAEQDTGSERSLVWKAKAAAYRSLRGGVLYGAAQWLVVTLVPSLRRARTIAQAVTGEGAGAFIYLAVTEQLWHGNAFGRLLWRAEDLAQVGTREPSRSLLDPLLERPCSTSPLNG